MWIKAYRARHEVRLKSMVSFGVVGQVAQWPERADLPPQRTERATPYAVAMRALAWHLRVRFSIRLTDSAEITPLENWLALACRKIRHHGLFSSRLNTKASMNAIAPSTTKTAGFPASAVATCVLDELIEAIKAEAAIKGVPLPTSRAAIACTAFEVDSLVVVANLCAVEVIVGFQLPESVVRAGGYSSAQAALDDLLPRIEAIWAKRNGIKP